MPEWHNRIVDTDDAVDPGTLTANPLNWRTHPDGQRAALDGVLDDVGWVQHVVVNRRTGHVIDGHLRAVMAQERGETVPVVYVDLSEEEEALVLSTLDPLAAMAGKDEEVLAQVVSQVNTENETLRELLSALSPEAEQAEASGVTKSPDDIPPAPAAEPEAKPGDIWQLGDHRVICADLFEDPTLPALLGEKYADMVATDPPYAIYGSSTGIGSSIADDKMVRPFFEQAFRRIRMVVVTFGHLYFHCDWRSWPALWEAAGRAQLTPKNLLVWDKGGSGLGSSYTNSYELIGFFASLPEQTAMVSTMRRGQRKVHRSNVLRFNRASGAERQHNAAKPVDLVGELIQNSTDGEGDIVLDPFLGSGSTLIAAERAGRRCYGVEIEPKYVDVTVKRWEAFTGGKAERVDNIADQFERELVRPNEDEEAG